MRYDELYTALVISCQRSGMRGGGRGSALCWEAGFVNWRLIAAEEKSRPAPEQQPQKEQPEVAPQQIEEALEVDFVEAVEVLQVIFLHGEFLFLLILDPQIAAIKPIEKMSKYDPTEAGGVNTKFMKFVF